MIANQPNGGNDITYVAQTAPGVTMNTGMGYGNFQTLGSSGYVECLHGERRERHGSLPEPEQLRRN